MVEHQVRPLREQCGGRRVAPGDRRAGDAGGTRGRNVAHLVADRERVVRLDAGTSEHAAEFRWLAEQRCAAGEIGKQCGVGFAELATRIGFVVGAHQRKAHAAVDKDAQHGVDAGEERDVGERGGLEAAHMSGDRRQFPERHFQSPQDVVGAGVPQRLDLTLRDPPEAEAIGHVVHMAQELRVAVGERAIEIEDDEGRGRGGRHRPVVARLKRQRNAGRRLSGEGG